MTTPPPLIPDAAPANWVDRYAPEGLRPWLRLGRFDRPVGIWLLYLPGAMGLMWGWNGQWSTFPLGFLILFLIGAALMRAAGCAFNDFVDRDFDAQVERTRNRPIPAGQITPKQAVAFAAVCCLISFFILIQLGPLAIGLGFASLLLVAAYPFMKRITWWPQAWLGLTFNWGFPMAVAAMTGEVVWAAWVFYAGLIFWTIGYDTVYALQDMEDDAMIGVKSSARAMKGKVREGVAVCYGLAVLLTCIAAVANHAGGLFYIGLLGVSVHLVWQVVRIQPHDGVRALSIFKSNRLAGGLWAAALMVAQIGIWG